MASYRPIRVGELLQTEIAALLARHLKDPRLQMSTVSRVDVTPDLRYARVYISHIGDTAAQQAALAGFAHAAGFIRTQLGKRLKLRYIPQLIFHLDTTIAYGARIASILHDLATPETPDTLEGNYPHA